MSTKMNDCLSGKDPNRLYPFLIIHDESREDLAEEIEAIYQSGCGGLCVENRGHEDFAGERWWSDIKLILDECKKRDMKVWLGDDVCFPTGAANWALRDKYPERKRKLLAAEIMDLIGPKTGAGLLVENFLKDGEEIFEIIGYKRTVSGDKEVYETPVILTDKLTDGVLIWDVPEGLWRIYIIFTTQVRCPEPFINYIDMIDPESCKLMIEEVYEPHYQNLKEYFGNTLEGFFTDESCFENRASFKFTFDEKVGSDTLLLPWRNDITDMIASEEKISKEEVLLLIPSFWDDIGGKTPVIRRRYMDIITRLYGECFSQLLGDWCREHGVLYTGHIIEDDNAHMRTTCSSGHFFRSMQGQDTAGFDLVLQQLMPGNRSQSFRAASSAKYINPDFYLYAIGRLAVSQANLYPYMKGKVMCECAGANGWSEGLPAKKYFLDAMIAGGGNIFIPFVFDPRRDNPHLPSFAYDHGENPQYPYNKVVMRYLNRICHILSDGTHFANALVYYPAEGDWCGNVMLPEEAVTPLALSHIDYEFAPWDILKDDTITKDGKIKIANEVFDTLIVPSCEILPKEILDRFEEIAKEIPVIFANELPQIAETGEKFIPVNSLNMPIDNISQFMKDKKFIDFELDGAEDLMHIHISHKDSEAYFFFNTSASSVIDTTATFKNKGIYSVYDAMDNTKINRYTENGEIPLVIEPNGTLIIIFGNENEISKPALTKGEIFKLDFKPIDNETIFKVSMIDSKEKEWKEFGDMKANELKNLTPLFPRFAGTIKYSATVKSDNDISYLNLGEVGEIASVSVNDIDCGACVTYPYIINVKEAWKKGENQVEITVASNCAYKKRDWISTTMQISPTGLIGPIKYV